MPSYNKVILMGNLVRDPELRVTASGLSICRFGLAINRLFQTKDGEKKEEVTFVDVDCFGKTADTVAKYFSKGKPMFMEGRLKLDSWETPHGERRSRLGVILESFQFIADTGGNNSGGSGRSSGPRSQQAQGASGSRARSEYELERQSAGGPADDDDDVPF